LLPWRYFFLHAAQSIPRKAITATSLAEQRARKYWEKHASGFGSNPVYLAVETSKIFPSEVQDLWPKLINSETTASFFAHGMESQT
jgi:hypothetical protein